MKENCRQVQELMSAYHDGEASADELDLVDEHMAQCECCTEYLRRLSRTVEAVKDLPVTDVPENVYIQELRHKLEAPPSWTSQLEALFQARQAAALVTGLSILLLAVFVGHNEFIQAPQARPLVALPQPAASPAIVVAKAPAPAPDSDSDSSTALLRVAEEMKKPDRKLVKPTSVIASPDVIASVKSSVPPVPPVPSVAPVASDGGGQNGSYTSGVDWEAVRRKTSAPNLAPVEGKSAFDVPALLSTVAEMQKLFPSILEVAGKREGITLSPDGPDFTGQILLEVHDLPAFFSEVKAELDKEGQFDLFHIYFDPRGETDMYLRQNGTENSAESFGKLRSAMAALTNVRGILSVSDEDSGLSQSVVRLTVRPVGSSR